MPTVPLRGRGRSAPAGVGAFGCRYRYTKTNRPARNREHPGGTQTRVRGYTPHVVADGMMERELKCSEPQNPNRIRTKHG